MKRILFSLASFVVVVGSFLTLTAAYPPGQPSLMPRPSGVPAAFDAQTINATPSYLSLGSSCTTSRGMGVNDICINVDAEVNGKMYFEGGAEAWSGSWKFNDNIGFNFGTGGDIIMVFGTAPADPDVFFFEVGAEANYMLFTEAGGRLVNYGTSLSQTADATVYVSGNTSDVDDVIGISHDGTNAQIISGEGGIEQKEIDGTTMVTWFGAIEATTTTEPVACSASTLMSVVYVDDTDDSSPPALCVCMPSSDDGAGTPNGYDWHRLDANSTACPDI